MECVRTERLTKTYKDRKVPVEALSGIDLTVEAGEFLAIVGPSGSGKTTLLNLIGGLDRPTDGEIYLQGSAITGLARSEMANLRLNRIGFVFQDYNLIPVLTAVENVEYVMLLQGVDKRERREQAMGILKEVGLSGLEARRPYELSGGQQQRVAVARAISTDPALVLADEPTANLDSATGASLLDLMRRLNEEKGLTFVLSTHDPLVIERANRVVRMRDGMLDRTG